MQEINNVEYCIQVDYINDSKSNVSVCKKLKDNGIEFNSIKVGDVCLEEETIKGRVLSGKLYNKDGCCGYKYNYENKTSDYLVNINENIPLDNAISLINKTKMKGDFLNAKMFFNLILRKDYKTISLQNKNINIIKSISAVNDSSDNYFYQEKTFISNFQDESFLEGKNEKTFKINGVDIVEKFSYNNQNEYVDLDKSSNVVKQKMKQLLEIVEQNPKNYKELMSIIDKIQGKII